MSKWNDITKELKVLIQTTEDKNVKEKLDETIKSLISWKKENRSETIDHSEFDKEIKQLKLELEKAQEETTNNELKNKFKEMKGNEELFDDFKKLAGKDTDQWLDVFKKYKSTFIEKENDDLSIKTDAIDHNVKQINNENKSTIKTASGKYTSQ